MTVRSPVWRAIERTERGLDPFRPDADAWRNAPPSVMCALASDWCHPETGEPVGPLSAYTWASRDLDRRRVAAALGRSRAVAVRDELGHVYRVGDDDQAGERLLAHLRSSMVSVDARGELALDPDKAEALRMERYRVERVDLGQDDAGEWRGRLIVQGRELRADWIAAPELTAQQVARCGSGGGVVALPDGAGFRAVSYGCTSPLCPQCGHRHASQAVERYLPIVLGLMELGCVVLHVTRTQKTRPVEPAPGVAPRPVLLTREERRRGYWAPSHGTGSGYAVQGESLAEALERYRSSVRNLRNRDASSSAWWERWAVGSVHGCEYTGFDLIDAKGGAFKLRRPRWHVHGHELLILPPEAAELLHEKADTDGGDRLEVDGPLWREYVGHWMRHSDAGERGQKGRWIRGDEQAVRKALAEVLKYPYKAADLTDAQVIEAIACTKGAKMHTPSGVLHPSSMVARIGRWAREADDGLTRAGIRRGFDWWRAKTRTSRDCPRAKLDSAKHIAAGEHAGLAELARWDEPLEPWAGLLHALELAQRGRLAELARPLDVAVDRRRKTAGAARMQARLDAMPFLERVAVALDLARMMQDSERARVVYRAITAPDLEQHLAGELGGGLIRTGYPPARVPGDELELFAPLTPRELAEAVLEGRGAESILIGEWCRESGSVVDSRWISIEEVWASVATWCPPSER